jgi:hypothetical protein
LVNPDTIYLNQFIRYAKEGIFKGLTNKKLQEMGQRLKFYKGVPDIFDATTDVVKGNSRYEMHDIKVEHYIVSTGMKRIIEGSVVMGHVKHVWGCDLIEGKDNDGDPCIAEIGYTIDNTSKTRALFEINKGTCFPDSKIKVNDKIPEDHRRVHFINMVYVADGPSDVPAFSVVNKNGGATFAIYPKGNTKAFKQVERLREDGRINMFAEADYSEDTTARMWLCSKVEEFAERIVSDEKARIEKYAGRSPSHLAD